MEVVGEEDLIGVEVGVQQLKELDKGEEDDY